MSWAQTTRFTWTCPVFLSTWTSAMEATYAPASVPQATPKPRPLGVLAGVQPNASAAALRTLTILWSVRFCNRNATGSMPTLAAMASICDSRAKVLVLLAGARQGPVANGWALPSPLHFE